MTVELDRDNLIMRADGDVLELFHPGQAQAVRIMLRWLVVQAVPFRNSLQLHFYSSTDDQPMYAVVKKTNPANNALVTSIDEADEPAFRGFFLELAGLSGRTM